MPNRLILGITTIGDLLLRNTITTTETGNPLTKINLKIPAYQRPYKWTAKNANQLLDDILLAMDDNKEKYRVGTLILHYDVSEESYNIVDGQQRTITFSLMLKSLCKEGTEIDFLKQNLSVNSYNIHNVINNFKALDRRIDNIKITEEGKESKEIKDLREYILNHCELIVVITTDLSEAFQFFDSQNARGKSLYPHDLLKAYHLREMNQLGPIETEIIVKMWENLNQKKLATLFNDYLYRIKEWIKDNRSYELTEQNIDIFKGVTSKDKHPYAQYYKGAFAFADQLNQSYVPFVTGIQHITPFQLNAPIIAGKPFFEYAKHYFDILADIQNNDKYEGFYINDNEIVKTLDLPMLKKGTGNKITRLIFDTAILLYVDRFCPERPSKKDNELIEQFVVFAFIWAYSMRAQYEHIGWREAQNYLMGEVKKNGAVNGFNIYKLIAETDSPTILLSKLTDILEPLSLVGGQIKANKNDIDKIENGIFINYLHFFKKYKYLEGSNNE